MVVDVNHQWSRRQVTYFIIALRAVQTLLGYGIKILEISTSQENVGFKLLFGLLRVMYRARGNVLESFRWRRLDFGSTRLENLCAVL